MFASGIRTDTSNSFQRLAVQELSGSLRSPTAIPWRARADQESRHLIPHLVFVALQGPWRLARGRLRPFVLGKCGALRAWREIKARRQFRSELAKKAVAPPHFALGAGSIQDVRNHLTRPADRRTLIQRLRDKGVR